MYGNEHPASNASAGDLSSFPLSGWLARYYTLLARRFTLTPGSLPERWRRPMSGYVAAVALCAITVTVNLVLVLAAPGIGFLGALPLVGTMVVALGWGLGPAMLCSFLSALALNMLIVLPRLSWSFSGIVHIAGFLVYLGSGVAISLVASDVAYHHQEARQTQTRLAAALAAEQQALAQAEQERRKLAALAHQVVAERDRLRQVLDVLPVAVLIADTDGKIIMANQGMQEILGFQMLGRHMSVVDPETARLMDARRPDGTSYPPADLPLTRAVLHGETLRGAQLLFQNRLTGKQTSVLAVSAPLHDPAGSRIGGMVVFQDIGPLKALERQREEFLASISHDLKNPLTLILGMSSLLQRHAARLPEADRERILPHAAGIGRVASRMTGQINELLDLMRMQMGEPLGLQRKPVDLVKLLADLVAEYQQESDRHTLHFAPAVASLIGHYDPARLERAFVNVLANAIKYSPRGGEILITLQAEDQCADGWITIRIRDQGIGIPAADLPRVFDRFYRASNVSDQITGTGLGLAGVRQVVEQHGGTVGIESSEGAGATVTIRLPRRQQGDAPDSPAASDT